MTFYEIVCKLNLGKWHELFALQINPKEINCIPFLQVVLHMSPATMKIILDDFLDLRLGRLNITNPDIFEINVDTIISICQNIRCENVFAQRVNQNSLMTKQQILPN